MFEQKNSQALVALDMIAKNFKLCDQWLADMYFLAAKQLYTGAPRDIVDSRSQTVVRLNERQWDPETMSVKILNNVNDIQRYTVNVAEIRVGPGRRATELNKYTQLLPVISNPIIKAMIENQVIGLTEASDEFKALADKATKAYIENQLAQMSAGTANADAGKAQALQTVHAAATGPMGNMMTAEKAPGSKGGQGAPTPTPPGGMPMGLTPPSPSGGGASMPMPSLANVASQGAGTGPA